MSIVVDFIHYMVCKCHLLIQILHHSRYKNVTKQSNTYWLLIYTNMQKGITYNVKYICEKDT